MLCSGVDCSDGNDCTADVCDPQDGTCSNPNEADGSTCDFGGLPGICTAGVCEDAMLCDGVDCSDGNDCTEDLCDPADGSCSNPNEPDDTACDFGGLPGLCAAGVCEDAMLCDGVDCSDGNDCTADVCDPQDGSCSNPNEPDDTVCDAAGTPGTCQGGTCVADCSPAPGISVILPTSGLPTPTYTDVSNGFTISAADCAGLPKCDVTFSAPRGIGANAYGDALRIDPFDSLQIDFFDLDGNPQDASNVSILLFTNGIEGTVEVAVDGGAPSTVTATPGLPLDLSGITGHSFKITLTNSVPTAFHFWSVLSYDHECL
jgi:hypothetical protein